METKNQALNLIKQAIDLAITKGVFNLMDVKNILEALAILETPDTPPEQE
jgi:hypothetical protein